MSNSINLINRNKEEIKNILQNDFNTWKNEMTTGETKENINDSDIFEILSEATSNFIIAVDSINDGMRFAAEPIKLLYMCTVRRSLKSYTLIFKQHFIRFNKERDTLSFYVTYNIKNYYDNSEHKAKRKGWNIETNPNPYVIILHNKKTPTQYFVKNISNISEYNDSKESDWNKSFIERRISTDGTDEPKIEYDNRTIFRFQKKERDMIDLFKYKSDYDMKSEHEKEYKLFYEEVTGLSFYEKNKENIEYNSLDELVEAAPIRFWQKPILKKMIEIKSGEIGAQGDSANLNQIKTATLLRFF